MGWFTRTFGNVGTVRFEYTTIDGKTYSAKTKIEAFNMDNEDIRKELINALYVEHGIKCISLKIVGYSGT